MIRVLGCLVLLSRDDAASSGNLAMLFSDERQNATYSQFIGEVISTDGGMTWSANADGSANFGSGEI
jgi:hypothetical protein